MKEISKNNQPPSEANATNSSLNKGLSIILNNHLGYIQKRKAKVLALFGEMVLLYVLENEGLNAEALDDLRSDIHSMRKVILHC